MRPAAPQHQHDGNNGDETGHAVQGEGVRLLLEVSFTRREMGAPLRFQDRPQHLEQELHEPTVEAAEAAAREVLHGLQHPPNGTVGPATIASWSLRQAG